MVDVCVVGRSLPALAAALELVEVGLRVRIADGPSGRSDWPVAPLRDTEGALRSLLERVAAPIADGAPGRPEAAPVQVPPVPVLLRDASGGWAVQPEPSVLGIPAVPMSAESLAFLRGGAGVRAYLDRIKPLLTIGKTHSLGRLVRSRMGGASVERLVDPLVRERFGVAADDVDVAIAAPGLNEALTRAGSLSGAVLAYAERHVARETAVAPAGGWEAARLALLERLALYDAEFAGAPVVGAVRGTDGWVVEDRDGAGFEASALLVDRDSALRGPVLLEETLSALNPERVRVHAIARIPEPGDLPEGVAVETIELGEGRSWSLRTESLRMERGGVAARAVLAGPAVPASGDRDPRAEAARALEAAGATLGDVPDEFDLTVRAAPFATAAERDAAAEALAEARAADASLLPLGASLHGDDRSAAVADAVAAAVRLRRRLTGIAES